MSDSALAIADDSLCYLPLDHLAVADGFNPRTYFDEAKHAELVASIRDHGVVQPLLVRPRADQPERYFLIAGERRWRAAREAALETVPVIIRDVDEREARILSVIENKDRDGVSPGEEARAARLIVDACDGDRDEAAKRLGWSRSVLEARLLLLHAVDDVLAALASRKIKIGHAELLATLPDETQSGTCTKLIDEGWTVADLRSRLDQFAFHLRDAIFDTAACNRCPHNTSTQASLFDQSIGEGRCTNRVCWGEKREAKIVEQKTALAEVYPLIYTDQEKDPVSYVVITKSGKDGVGKSQFEQGCKGCGSFGALMDTSPGREGKVTEDCCFDVGCHKQKVKAYAASLVEEQEEPATASPAKLTKGKVVKKKVKKTKIKASANVTPGKVTDIIDRFYRNTAATVATGNARLTRLFATWATLKLAGDDKLNEKYKLGRGGIDDLDEALPTLAAMDDTMLDTLMNDAVVSLLKEHTEHKWSSDVHNLVAVARAVLPVVNADVADHFVVTEEFLLAHTKSGVESLMSEAGFDQWYDTQYETGAFAKLIKRKNSEIVETIMGSGFDFARFVPKSVAGN